LPKPVLLSSVSPDAGGDTLPLTLARLTDEFLQVADLLIDADPSDVDGLAQVQHRLDRSAAAIEGKAGAIAALIREFEARANAAQSEADRIAAHAKTAKAHAAWLREYLLQNLLALGVDRIQTTVAVIAIREGPPAAEVLDEKELPDAFKRVVTSVDKASLRTALMDGEVVSGARLTRGKYLSIR
jgi:hypothetical protein